MLWCGCSAYARSIARQVYACWHGLVHFRDVGCDPDSRQLVKHGETSVWAMSGHRLWALRIVDLSHLETIETA